MKTILFANTDWYLYNFRLPLAKALRERGAEVTLLSPPGAYAARLEAEGFRWLAFPLERGGMNPLTELATILRLIKLYRRERPDLVHHFTVKPVLYGSLAARLAGVPAVVNSITGLGYLFLGQGMGRRLLRALARTLYRVSLGKTHLIFQNDDDRRAFLDRRLARPGQAHLVPGSGVDVNRFVPAAEPEEKPVVLLAARLLWDKGVGEFVEAARLLGSRARFVLVGDTDAANPAAVPPAQLRAWQEENMVEWLGWQEDMPAVLAGANIFCLPSYREGLSKILAEAAACGRAIVTTDTPGCRDVVTHGVNGLLVPPRDAGALAEAIAALLDSPSLRRQMGAAARRIAEERFSVEKIVAATLEVYREAGVKGLLS